MATPDGKAPQLDVNGLSLAFHAMDRMTSVTVRTMLAQARKDFSAPAFRAKFPELVTRRESELELAYQLLGKLRISDPLPNTDKEAADLHSAVASAFDVLQDKPYLSIREILEADDNPDDAFSLSQVGFIHMPGGHAPMVDFIENPWIS
ncbi:hypothetical protein [Serratia plymuthica]|uniref:hypothetical protein n=1 Tax=Serratia plymuthica TaxID=82996 RepID=UPI001419AC13|nr:hypothetical protein [Serratia plymuthica]NIC28528.1 hypothetical protein [Serratia plymuthica]